MNIIETTNLSKCYKTQMRVNHLHLKVPKSCVYGFLGPNGAGKTTTLKLILGLIQPTEGTVSIFGKQMTEKNRLSILRNTGSLIESPSYYGHLTGEENLKIAAKLKKLPEKEILEVLHTVRLTEQKDKLVKHYSLGMKQRLGIAMALLGNPQILILDEPTNGLDPAGIQEMRELIMALPSTFDMTVLVSSHILSEIEQMADMVGIISNGELVFQDTMEKLHSMSKQQLFLRVSDREAAQNILNSKKITFAPSIELPIPAKAAESEEDYLAIPILEDRFIAMLLKILIENGISVYRIEEHRKNLEDIFLELTGRSKSL